MELVNPVGPQTQKDTFRRKSVDPGLQFAMTIQYLTPGDIYKSL